MMTKISTEFNFSYSSVNTFQTCAYAFYLTYIEKAEREGNYWSDYGSLVHDIAEKYFKNELDIFDLGDYYEHHYVEAIKHDLPDFMLKYAGDYYEAGLKFFKEFSFDRNQYEIINTETFVKGGFRGINVVVKPDLVFRHKDGGDIILLDFKTSEIEKKGKIDKNKLQGYKNQLNLYVHLLWEFLNLEIRKARLWFIRSNTYYDWEYEPFEANDFIEEFVENAKNILETNEWKPNNTKTNQFFCNNLCGVRSSCKFRNEIT